MQQRRKLLCDEAGKGLDEVWVAAVAEGVAGEVQDVQGVVRGQTAEHSRSTLGADAVPVQVELLEGRVALEHLRQALADLVR